MIPLVAIVGRPNVGKSTLFNRLVGGRRAIVEDEPGVTRDRHYAIAVLDGRKVQVVDTGGFILEAATGIESLVREQTQVAVEEADVILHVMDAREGLLPDDLELASRLRQAGKPILHVANKADGPQQDLLLGEFYRLGAAQVLGISAEHARGIGELTDAVLQHLPPAPADEARAPEEQEPIRVTLVGRPNAGKSSLLNALLGESRVIVSATPGTTRDPVDVQLTTEAGSFVLVDTAGIRRRRTKSTAMERYAIVRAMRSINSADVTCLVMDAQEGATEQDAKVANLTEEAGRGLVLVLTKTDLLVPTGSSRLPRKAREQAIEQVREQLHFVGPAPLVLISSVTGQGIEQLLPTVRRVHDSWNTRVPTSQLNPFLQELVAAHAPPARRGHPVRFYYITQAQARPPTFLVSTNAANGVPLSYRRYLINQLRERFGFAGAPVRLYLRQRQREPRGS